MAEITQNKLTRANEKQLREWAAGLDVEVSADEKPASIRTKLATTLGFADIHEKVEVQDTKSMFQSVPKLAPAFPDDPEKEAERDKEDLKPITIIIPSSEDDKQPVPVIVNGRQWVIQRDMEATIPMYVYKALTSAKKGIVHPETREVRYTPHYPIQVIF